MAPSGSPTGREYPAAYLGGRTAGDSRGSPIGSPAVIRNGMTPLQPARATVHDAEKRLVDRDDLLIDPVLVESFDQPPESIVHAAMAHVWQAAGWPRSLNFTEDHKWKPPGR